MPALKRLLFSRRDAGFISASQRCIDFHAAYAISRLSPMLLPAAGVAPALIDFASAAICRGYVADCYIFATDFPSHARHHPVGVSQRAFVGLSMLSTAMPHSYSPAAILAMSLAATGAAFFMPIVCHRLPPGSIARLLTSPLADCGRLNRSLTASA